MGFVGSRLDHFENLLARNRGFKFGPFRICPLTVGSVARVANRSPVVFVDYSTPYLNCDILLVPPVCWGAPED